MEQRVYPAKSQKAPIEPMPAEADLPAVDTLVDHGSRSRWLALAMLLFAWGLRLSIFDDRQLGEDGYLSVGLARLDLDQSLAYFLRDIHPPLFYLLLRVWTGWLGPGFLVARWIPLASGLVSAALLTSTLRVLFGRQPALIGLTLYTFAPAAILQAATVRDYSLGTALSLLSWRLLLTSRSSAVSLTAIGATTFGALGVWYFHLCSLPLQLGFAWRQQRTATLPLIAASALALPWYLGVVLTWLPRWGTERLGAITPFQSNEPAQLVYLAGAGRSVLGDLPIGASAGLALVWILFVLAGAGVLVRQGRPGLAATLAGGSVLGYVATITISLTWGGPDFVPRYFLVVLLYGIAAATALLMTVPHPLLRYTSVVLLVLPGTIFFVNFLSLRAGGGPRALLSRMLAAKLDPTDLVVFDNLEDHGYFWLANQTGAATLALHTFGIGPWSDRDADRAAERANHRRIGAVWWVHHALNQDPVALSLESRLVAYRSVVAADEIAHWIAKETSPPAPRSSISGEFGDGIRLVAVQIPSRAETCRRLPIASFWRTDRSVPDDLTLFAHIVDSTGRRIAQEDGPPFFGGHSPAGTPSTAPMPDVRWIALAPNITPGHYTVQLGLYDDHGNVPLRDGRDRLTVGSVELVASCLALSDRQ